MDNRSKLSLPQVIGFKKNKSDNNNNNNMDFINYEFKLSYNIPSPK